MEAKVRRSRSRVVSVWALFLALAAVIGVIEFLDRGAESEKVARESARDPRLLVPVPFSQVGAVEVSRGGTRHRFERDAVGTWFYHGAHDAVYESHSHAPNPALAERIDTALRGLDRARIERELPIDAGLERYGLARPQMLILVYRPVADEPLLQVAVGDVAPDGFSRYVMPAGGRSVLTIAEYQIENLVSLVGFAVEAETKRE